MTLDVLWSHERLRALTLPVEQVAVDELRRQLTLPMWSFDGVAFAISAEQVRADPSRFHVQYARTMAADLTFALHALVRAGRPRTLLDGVRRLLKADLLGHAIVAVKDLPAARLNDIAVSAPYPGRASRRGRRRAYLARTARGLICAQRPPPSRRRFRLRPEALISRPSPAPDTSTAEIGTLRRQTAQPPPQAR